MDLGMVGLGRMGANPIRRLLRHAHRTVVYEVNPDADIVIDGGSSFYQDDIVRAADLAEPGIRLAGVGTSGGVFGLDRGFCPVVGGDADADGAEMARRLYEGDRSIPAGRVAQERAVLVIEEE